jgi:hypothetical protein
MNISNKSAFNCRANTSGICAGLRQHLGTLLHQTIENQNFATAFCIAEGKGLQQMHHQLDGCGQPQCYRLQAIASHISRSKVCNKLYTFTHNIAN